MEMLIKTQLPTEWGDFEVFAYQNVENDAMPHLALVSKNFNPEEIVTVRIHSECLTGDIFKSKRCDCGEQLNMAMIKIAKDNGILLYMRQEGRGIGIVNKLNAYNLQDEGMNTYEANQHLGLEADGRHYRDAIIILKSLRVEKINLLTNNPLKIDAFRNSGIVLYKRIPITALPKKENKFYLHTKKIVKGHLIDNI
jgi:3,4-dihydroxy 2-butanone 4-phosphate synthase/GTP cyclohydrolase II